MIRETINGLEVKILFKHLHSHTKQKIFKHLKPDLCQSILPRHNKYENLPANRNWSNDYKNYPHFVCRQEQKLKQKQYHCSADCRLLWGLIRRAQSPDARKHTIMPVSPVIRSKRSSAQMMAAAAPCSRWSTRLFTFSKKTRIQPAGLLR